MHNDDTPQTRESGSFAEALTVIIDWVRDGRGTTEDAVAFIVQETRERLLDSYTVGAVSDEFFLHGMADGHYLARVAMSAAAVEALGLDECRICLAGELHKRAESSERGSGVYSHMGKALNPARSDLTHTTPTIKGGAA